ncbi:MAG: ATP-binding protein, partial [Gammaproteobacteria bacterium]
DGAAFVPLATVRDPDYVLTAIAAAIGVRENGDRPFDERLAVLLRDRTLLLVVDNVEHLPTAALQIAALLAACPGLTMLATSRAPLLVSGERTLDVPPLTLPPDADDGPTPRPDEVLRAEAVRLFVERAQAVRADFALTETNASAVAAICRRLDGLPLAIELAAARVRMLPPHALLGRLSRRLPLLTGGAHDAPGRHRTMRDAIAWSYDLLADSERALFRRLSIFAGAFTLESAEMVAGRGEQGAPDAPLETLDGVALLVDKSLLRQEAGPDDEPTFVLLETIREFGREQLVESGESEAIGRRHAAWYLRLAERAAPELFGPEQRRWAERLDREHANLRAALTWLLDQGDAPRLVRL